jgi:hypothetical protein
MSEIKYNEWEKNMFINNVFKIRMNKNEYVHENFDFIT